MYKTFNASQNNPTGTQYFSGSQHTQNLSKFYGFSLSSFLVSSFKNSCIYDMFIVEIFAISGNIKVVSKTNCKLEALFFLFYQLKKYLIISIIQNLAGK